MNTITNPIRQDELISQVYQAKRDVIIGYIYKRIGKRCDAEDLAHDLFIQLLGYTTLLNKETLTNLIFTIARNLTIDYLRRHARSKCASEYFYFRAERSSHTTEEQVLVSDLADLENKFIEAMSPQKSKIYRLSTHEGISSHEIATICNISQRTAENHIYNSRREMRQALSAFVG